MSEWDIPRVAVIATRDREPQLLRCLAALAPQCDRIYVIDNADHPHDYSTAMARLTACHPPVDPPIDCVLDVVWDPEQPPNLSRLWNLGIDEAAKLYRAFGRILERKPMWDVAVVNDDATVPPGWFDAVAGAMRKHGADAACADPWDGLPPGGERYFHGGPPSIDTRLAGWAFVLRGEWEGARLDESMRWWFADDDLSYRAKLAGGLVHVGGHPVPNEFADQSTRGVLAEQAGRDRAAFVAKHGGVQPW